MRTSSCLWLALSLAAAQAPAADALTESFQKALFEEEANQNLEAAIQGYQAVLQAADAQRKLVATALFRLGECYRKLGRTNDAVARFQRLLRDFSDQTNLVTLSRQNLRGLGATPGEPPESPAGLAAATDDEEKEIRRIQVLVQNSPDLINAPGPAGEPTPLMLAAQRGHLAVARYLLAAGAQVDAWDKDGATALHYAVRAGHKAMVELLLAHGSDPNAQDKAGSSPLSIAAARGFRAVAETLLDHNADPNLKDRGGRTPLFAAVEASRADLVELLLSRGADPTVQDGRGWTALHEAAERGLERATALLLAGHTNLLEVKTLAGRNPQEPAGETPLAVAVRCRQPQIAALLLKAGANPNVKVGGQPLLCKAIGQSDLPSLKLLLAHKPDLEAVDDNSGYTPLQSAVVGGQGMRDPQQIRQNVEAVRLLLEAGAQVDRPFKPRTVSRPIPDFPGAPGAWPASDDITGATPLVVASKWGVVELVECLLAHGANVNASDAYGQTPLHHAVLRGSEPTVEAILKHKPNLEARNRDGRTALALAVGAGQIELVRRLAQAGSDLNVSLPDRDAASPLHVAVQRRNTAMVELLVGLGANPNPINAEGDTPLEMARQLLQSAPAAERKDWEQIVACLLQHGADERISLRFHLYAGREATGFRMRIFSRGTNDWNRHTLLEVLAAVYGQAPDLCSQLAFPDLARVKVLRLGTNGGADRVLTANVEQMLRSGACTNDLELEWGDVVIIPEVERRIMEWHSGDVVIIPKLDHPIDAKWQGLDEQLRTALARCLERQVTVLIQGQSHKLVLSPKLWRPGDPVVLPPPRVVGPVGGVPSAVPGVAPLAGLHPIPYVGAAGPTVVAEAKEGGLIAIKAPAFRLKEILQGCGLLRTSSDLSRVRVRRTDPATGGPVEWVVDLSPSQPYNAAHDLWLRDGDVIEVPDK
jgi:ankyrin repeat protein